MKGISPAVAEKVAWLNHSDPDWFERYQADPHRAMGEIEGVKEWLCRHPQETVQSIQQIQLGKPARSW